jgi:hypothetical protein
MDITPKIVGQGSDGMDITPKIVGQGSDGYGGFSQLYTWAPKPDITTFELAQAMPALIQMGASAGLIRRKAFEGLPESIRRHFTVEETKPY